MGEQKIFAHAARTEEIAASTKRPWQKPELTVYSLDETGSGTPDLVPDGPLSGPSAG